MRRIIVGMMLGCAVLSAKAADESLAIGGVQLTLGMERNRAIELLQKSNIVNCLGATLEHREQQPTKCDLAVARGSKTNEDFTFLGKVLLF